MCNSAPVWKGRWHSPYNWIEAMDFLKVLLEWLSNLLGGRPPAPPPDTGEPVGGIPQPVRRRVLQITFNPLLPSEGGVRLIERMGWNAVESLASTFINDIQVASFGYLNYQVVERVLVDGFPAKVDGFIYTPEAYLDALQRGQGHQPDGVDYARLLNTYRIVEKVRNGLIDEVWVFGGPYFGFYESVMAGPGAFFCNAPPLPATQAAGRRFIIMGFNYQRDVGEMLEAFAHRAEFIMARVFQHTHGEANLWERFTRYEKIAPGAAECGTVHYAPNSRTDYDWGNPTPVLSRCRNWRNFPNLSGAPVWVDCREWGNGDMRLHHLWWLSLFPHVTGQSNGIAYNWWQYVADPNGVS